MVQFFKEIKGFQQGSTASGKSIDLGYRHIEKSKVQKGDFNWGSRSK